MQSPLAIVLRASVLLGCLGFLPLMAAGGLSAPEKLYALAENWLATQRGSEPLTSPRTIQVELPADALRYREVGTHSDLASDEPASREVAEVMPASYEEILPPPSRDHNTTAARQSSSAAERHDAATQVVSGDQQFSAVNGSHASSPPTLAEVEARLREIGATDIRIEPWGSTGQLYRCCAVIPLAGSPEVQRYFQAISPSPDQAAREVLDQVTATARW